MTETLRTVTLTRDGENRYTAANAAGATLAFGRGEGLLTPVELLLAAIAGCASIDVDTVTTRRSEPDRFTVTATGDRVADEDGGVRLANLRVAFDLAFPDTDEGRQAASLVERCVRLSHDRNCTVSRTVEAATPVEMVVD